MGPPYRRVVRCEEGGRRGVGRAGQIAAGRAPMAAAAEGGRELDGVDTARGAYAGLERAVGRLLEQKGHVDAVDVTQELDDPIEVGRRGLAVLEHRTGGHR